MRARQLIPALLAAMVSLAGMSMSRAQDYYAGKTIHFFIGYTPGGGYDLYSRVLARHIGRHLPGNPSVVPQNMPGGGGLTVAAFMNSVAAKDGTSLAMAGSSVALVQALDMAPGGYDAGKFGWIGMITRTGAVPILYTWHTSGSKTFEDTRRRETIVGATAAGNTEYMPRVLNRMAGARFRIVSGYPGTTEIQLAVERGEVEGGSTILSELKERKPEWLRDRVVNPLVVIAPERLADLPDVPTVVEVGTTPENREVLRLYTAGELSRSVFTAPGTPPERVAQLRRAFDATIADPEFRADARRSSLYFDSMPGEELQRLVESIVSTPKDAARRAAEARR